MVCVIMLDHDVILSYLSSVINTKTRQGMYNYNQNTVRKSKTVTCDQLRGSLPYAKASNTIYAIDDFFVSLSWVNRHSQVF